MHLRCNEMNQHLCHALLKSHTCDVCVPDKQRCIVTGLGFIWRERQRVLYFSLAIHEGGSQTVLLRNHTTNRAQRLRRWWELNLHAHDRKRSRYHSRRNIFRQICQVCRSNAAYIYTTCYAAPEGKSRRRLRTISPPLQQDVVDIPGTTELQAVSSKKTR